MKDSIPQTLLIDGHNPLRLLHSALSDGLHDRDDSHCLEQASSIRVVLAELSERLSHALKDEAELNRALSHLLNRKRKPRPRRRRAVGRAWLTACGKRSNPDYKQISALVRKDTHRNVMRALLDEPTDRDVSDLLQALLEDWLSGRGGAGRTQSRGA